MQASRCIFHDFYDLTHFSHNIFWKKCFSPAWEAQFWKTASNTFDEKYHFFDPQTASKWADFVIIARSCCSVARSVRYVFASCPLQKQPVARLPCCFRLQAPFAKTMVCIALAILWISYAILCFLYAFHALHTPSFNFFVTFFENLLPALVGEHDFQKCMNVKSCQKQLLSPSNRTDYTYFGAVYGTWNSQNRWEKCVFLVYVPSLEALFAPMCSTACILHEIYIFSPCFRHDFASKVDPALGSHIAQICKATTACKICRIHVAMMSLDP